MQVPAVISHLEFMQYSPTIIGEEAARLGKLVDPHIPLTPVLCITRETLLEISQYNSLEKYLRAYLQTSHSSLAHTKALQELKLIFLQQKLPKHLTESILTWYHEGSKTYFTKVFTSHHVPGQGLLSQQHIEGDSNTIQSLLEVWWESLTSFLQQKPDLHSSLQLAPTALCIQKEPQVLTSGVAYSINPHTGSKTSVMIEAVWGLYDNSVLEAADSYEVDTHSWSLTQARKETQTEQVVPCNDGTKSSEVPKRTQDKAKLNENQTIHLAHITNNIKKRFMNQVAVYWVATGTHITITNVEPYYFEPSALERHSGTKLYLSAGNPGRSSLYGTLKASGIGLFKSDYIFATTGLHPVHAIRTKYSSILKKELVAGIETLAHTVTSRELVYRSLHLDSHILRQMAHSEALEPKEQNPFLGFKGALKAIHLPEVFQFELDVLKTVTQKKKYHLGLLLPQIRSKGELKRVLDSLALVGLDEESLDVWFPITTPENVLELNSYAHTRIKGYIIDCTALHALSLGIDTDNLEVNGHYEYNTELFKKYFHYIRELVAPTQQLVRVYVEHFSRELLELSVEYGFEGVIVKPKVAPHAKNCIIDFEKSTKNKKNE